MEDYLWVLKQSEQDLLREIEPDRMGALDEDALLALHKRIRRARNKHVTNYRRKASRDVEGVGGRGAARPLGSKSRLRAEAFEEALSRVSARLAEVAHEEAEKLKAERLARAQADRSTGPDSSHPDAGAANTGTARSHEKSTGGIKKDASSQAQGARRQAKRDGR